MRKPRRSGIEQILTDLGPLANLMKTLTPDLIKPFELLYTDFTEIVCKGGKLYLIPYLDHITKKVIGYEISFRCNTETALRAFSKAKRFLKNKNIPLSEVVIHQDQGSQFTSYDYVGELTKHDITLSYSRKGTPSDNPEMESFIGRLKDEWKDVFWEAETLSELKSLIEEAIKYYNSQRIHSAIGTSPDRALLKRTTSSIIPSNHISCSGRPPISEGERV